MRDVREDEVTAWKDRFQVFQVRPSDYEVIAYMRGDTLPNTLFCDTEVRIAMMDSAHSANEIIKKITGND